MSSISRRTVVAYLKWLVVAPLVLGVGLGGIEFHPDGVAHEALSHGGDEAYFPAASHPEESNHFDSGRPAKRPLCPACLFRTQTSGTALAASVAVLPPTVDESIGSEQPSASRRETPRHYSVRGPPASLLS